MLNYLEHILSFTFVSLFSFFSTRMYINSIIEYRLKRGERKRRKRGRTFKEWFFFTRYRDVAPPIMLKWYFCNVIVYLITVITLFIMCAINFDGNKAKSFYIFVGILMILPQGVVGCFFTDRRKPFWWGIPRWVDPKKRYKK